MTIRVSRRNGRDKRDGFRKRELMLFALAMILCCSGIISMAAALDARQSAISPSAKPTASPREPHGETSAPRYEGALRPMASEEEPADDDSNAVETDEAIGDMTAIDEGAPDADRVSERSHDEALGSMAPAPTAPSEAPRQTGVIHHTKYREEPVNRIVHHQASTAREITENGRTRIEWSKCPVCYGRHDSAFNESIVDSVKPVPCSACGERHDADYDEPIYD